MRIIGTRIAKNWMLIASIAMVTISVYRKIYYSDAYYDLAFDTLAFISGVGFFGGWLDKKISDATMRMKGEKNHGKDHSLPHAES